MKDYKVFHSIFLQD